MDVAGQFKGLTPERKKQIIEHFASLPEAGIQKTYQQFQANGGPEAEFVKAIFEQRATRPAVAPQPAPKASEPKKEVKPA